MTDKTTTPAEDLDKLPRFDFRDIDGDLENFVQVEGGEYVKFADVAALARSAATAPAPEKVYRAALEHAAFYVRDHLKDGDEHAEIIASLKLPSKYDFAASPPVQLAAPEQDIPDAWKILVAGLINELEATYKAIEQHAPKIEVSIGQFRRLRTAKEMLRAAGIPVIEIPKG